MLKKIILTSLLITGCSSTQLVNNWKNPEIVVFDAYKVLVIGMTQDYGAREEFETKLTAEFNKRSIEAIRSIDVFDVDFTNSVRTEGDLDNIEQQLLDKDFDAILLTKILGSENRKSFRRSMANINGLDRFKDDYLSNQPIYYEIDYYDDYTVYHAETSLYCICVDKERELIWQGIIDITDPIDISKTIDDYISLLIKSMEEQDILFRKTAPALPSK